MFKKRKGLRRLSKIKKIEIECRCSHCKEEFINDLGISTNIICPNGCLLVLENRYKGKYSHET